MARLPLLLLLAALALVAPAPVWLTMNQTPNGVGALVHRLVYAQAYAAERGWRFGGVAGADRLADSHFVSGNAVAAFFFGDVNSVLAAGRVPPTGGVSVGADCLQLHFRGSLAEAAWEPPEGAQSVFIPNIDNFLLEEVAASAAVPLDTLLNETFLTALRIAAAPGVAAALAITNHFAPSQCSAPDDGATPPPPPPRRRLVVAAHVRRGDVARGPPLATYLSLFGALQSLYPGRVEVHIFSEDMTAGEQTRLHQAAAGLGFTAAESWQLHVTSAPPQAEGDDDADTVAAPAATAALLEHAAHFVSADVFIAAVSMLSHSAAFFNPRCVVYTQPAEGDPGVTSVYLQHRPLRRWLVLDSGGGGEGEGELAARLRAFLPSCLPADVGLAA